LDTRPGFTSKKTQVISEEDWVERFVGRKEVREVYDEENEKTRLFIEEQKLDLKKKFDRESEETYLKNKEKNVEQSLRDLGFRSLGKISSDMMDEEFAESLYAKKPEPTSSRNKGNKRRIEEEGDLSVEENQNY